MEKKKIAIAAAIICFSVMLSSFGFYFHQVMYAPNFLYEQENRALVIPSGATFKDLQNLLYNERYLNDLVSFSFLAKLMDYDELIHPGVYLIERDMCNLDAIRMLRTGKQVHVNVTFSNARLFTELPEKITKHLEMSDADFLAVLDNDSLLNANGFDSLNVIGMFIPNTYQVYWNVSPKALFIRLKKEYDLFWNKERREKAQKIGLTPNEVSILASIVQAETIVPDERIVVAGLYMNRLNRKEPLMADPTVVFANQDFGIKRVLTKHTQIDSPFNTYKYNGLPPGPINMPEIASIDAVLNHAKHDFLFMCAKEDFSGRHNFAKTYPEHLNFARKFQEAMNRAGIYK